MHATKQGSDINGSLTPAIAGLVLLDAQNRVMYHNPEAAKILSFPSQDKKPNRTVDVPPPELLSFLMPAKAGSGPAFYADFKSGKRLYGCRVFVLEHNSGKSAHAITGILLERMTPGAVDISAMAKQFRLTGREQETIGLLTLGLTTKEIAARMNISPNTVKAFFRLVMTKMAVTTRAGIVGKIARLHLLG
jgi:DNA-binding CsgD family transcriptional regulator